MMVDKIKTYNSSSKDVKKGRKGFSEEQEDSLAVDSGETAGCRAVCRAAMKSAGK